jgi:hypothetical protein
LTDLVRDRTGNQLESQVASQVADQVALQLTSQATSQVADQVALQLTSQATSQVADQVTLQLTRQATSQVADQVTLQLTRQATSQVALQINHHVPSPRIALVGDPTSAKPGGQPKQGRIGRVLWIGQLNQALASGLANSQWLADVQKDQIGAGREICRELWPFIARLPDNIKCVKDKLPVTLEPAKLFLNILADEERSFQDLYIKQCELAGLSRQDLMTSARQPTAATSALLDAMSRACLDGDVVCGTQAIVAAELAAAQFSRSVKDAFELYFAQHSNEYKAEHVQEGLAWVRLHARTNIRHAIWMNRMLVALAPQDQSPILPPTVRQILAPIFRLWRVDKETAESWLGETCLSENRISRLIQLNPRTK